MRNQRCHLPPVKFYIGKLILIFFRYGREMEEMARTRYEEIKGQKVTQVGLVVKEGQSWLAASPDGCWQDEDGSIVVLEIKAPFSCKDKEEIDVPYLKGETLRSTHSYFTQVQLQMYCCNAQRCDFFVFSQQSYKLITVMFNAKFC